MEKFDLPTVKNKYKDSNGEYIGRGSLWGNPFVIGKDGDRDEVIKKYEEYLYSSGLITKIKLLAGKDLVCFCAPKPCHGDILLKLANQN